MTFEAGALTYTPIPDPWLTGKGESLDEVFGTRDADTWRTFNDTYHDAHAQQATAPEPDRSNHMTIDKAKATELRKPFPPESVGKLPKGGTMLDYVGHAAVTDRLLTVDPEWSWEPFAVGPDGLPALDRANNLWIRLTVCGMTRIGVGDGKNAKEAIGDAIRNAAMRFGVALDLWAKENLVEFAQAARATHAAPETQPVAEPSTDKPMTGRTRGQMFALFGQKGVEESAQLAGINAITGKAYESRGELTEADAKAVIAALKTRPDAEVAELQGGQS
jgi:hypothetical protein